MRITGLHIDGFGRFADRSFGPLERPVTVFYGPNEAGKSTLLEFIRRILFGFPTRRGGTNEYPPLAGGRHGGRITVATDAGEIITIDRTPGRGDGPVSLTSAAGEALPDSELPRLLGNHSRSVFQNIFAFTLDELNNESLLNDDSVNLQIYSAGIGAMKLPDALAALDRQKSEIFRPQGRNQLIPSVAQAIESTDAKLREIAGYATEYRRQSDRLAEIERELGEVGARRLQIASGQDRLENLERAWDHWNELISAEQRLAELPAVETFPENGVIRLETLEAQAETALEELSTQITALLKSGEAEDADDFRRRDRVFQERAGLNSTLSSALEQMQRISGPGDALDALRTTLANTDLQTIRDDVRRCEAQLEEIDGQRSELDTERGAIRTTLDGLAGEEDSSRLRLERHRLSEELQGHAREWTVRAIAENLIRQAQSKFEKERQPDVIRHAERFFLDVTDGAYQGVYSPLGSSEINARDAMGNIRTPQQLSRGTREQLFLALRFGLILEMGQRSERLPIIVDEALVNFDPTRGTRAAGSFIDLSETNQVLVFTCHPQIVEWFVDAADRRGVVEPDVVRI